MTTEFEYDSYLEHYGVPGMKWGKQKNSDSSSAPNRKQRKMNRIDAYSKLRDEESKNVRELNAEAKRLRNEEGVRRSKSLGEAVKNTGFDGKQERALGEYKQAMKDNTTRGDKVREVAGGALAVTAGAAIVADYATGGRLSRSAVSMTTKSAKKAASFVNSFDFNNVYVNPDGSRIRTPRPNFGGMTTQVFPKEVTKGRRALPR